MYICYRCLFRLVPKYLVDLKKRSTAIIIAAYKSIQNPTETLKYWVRLGSLI